MILGDGVFLMKSKSIVYYIMNLQESQKIIGLPEGISYGQFQRQDELNNRIVMRNIPDNNLKPNFDPRSVPTKYSRFPIVNSRTPSNVPYDKYLDHSVETSFTPINTKGPIHGFINNVHTESVLRNQFFALQRGADQAVYVPSSTSDLYKITMPISTTNEPQPFPSLWEQSTFNKNNRFTQESSIGNDIFSNNTRTQLRNTVVMK